MALQVWLPLNGNLNNQGLSDIGTPSLNGTSFIAEGKIGQASSGYAIWHLPNDIVDNSWSLACWCKSASWGQYNDILICNNTSGSEDCHFYFSIIGGTSLNIGVNGPSSTISQAYNFSANTWYHVAATYDGNTVSLYINGVKVKTGTCTTAQKTNVLNLGICCRSMNTGGTSATAGTNKLNDVRVYNHCLSDKEVLEISQCLVLHYPLKEIEASNTNLCINGKGELGTVGWSSGVKTDIPLPSGDTSIKACFRNSTSSDFIPIYPEDVLSYSCWLKAVTPSTSYVYPSFRVYDCDYKEIQHYHIPDGFIAASRTTLARPLSSGDTVIYATSIAGFNTASTHGNYCAIFDYVDGEGTVWPAMTYTRECPAFGTTTDKSHLDFTNNTITLNSPYTGKYRPAGTTICQSAAGSTYFYPYGGVVLNTISDWTYKTTNITVSSKPRLKYGKYIKIYTYSNVYAAGIELYRTNIGNTIYDCSGFGNHGTLNGTMAMSSDTVRYTNSVYIPSATTITHPRCLLNGSQQEWTCCAWIKPTSVVNYSQMNNFNSGNRFWHGTYPLLYVNSGTNDYYNYGNKAIVAGQWQHVAFVFKNGTVSGQGTASNAIKNIYINGVNQTNTGGPNKTSTPGTIPNTVSLFNANFEGLVSDYREYATALSPEAIENLYHVSASVDRNGALHTYELNEI